MSDDVTRRDAERARQRFDAGMALRTRRRLKAATACFRDAVDQQPRWAEAWFWLAVTLDNRGEEAEAIPAYRRAIDLGVGDAHRAQAWAWLGSSLSKMGQNDEALAAIAESSRLGGYEPRAEYEAVRTQVQRRAHRAALIAEETGS